MTPWHLPGPAAWFERLLGWLRRGQAVVVCFPSADAPPGFDAHLAAIASSMRPPLSHRHIRASLADEENCNPDRMALVIADEFGLSLPAGERLSPGQLLCDERTDGWLFHIDARGEPPQTQAAWIEFARMAAVGSKETPAIERAGLVISVSPDDELSLPQADTNLKVLWWWGVLGPLDIEVGIHASVIDPHLRAVIVETARWDLELASTLALQWAGGLDSLPQHLGQPSAELGRVPDGPADRTPGSVLQGWRNGMVESWDGRLDVHVRHVPNSLPRRRWEAQVRTIYPWLERLRIQLVEVISEVLANSTAGLSTDTEDLASMELGQLKHHALAIHRLTLPDSVRSVLRRAVSARNDLAHLTPISRTDLDGLREAVARAGLH